MFDNGYFSEFGTFSISDWIGHAPKHLLAKNFPASVFNNFPKNELYFAKGKVPPAVAAPPLTHKYSLLSQKPFEVLGDGLEWRVDGTQFPISTTMTGLVLEMEPGSLRELHWHPNAAEWQYILSGEFNVTLFGSQGRWREETLGQGDVGYIPQGFGHSIENISSGKAKLVLLCPAWKKFGSARTIKPDTVILHSRADDVVPFADSEELARNSGVTLIEVGTDHRLADPEPLAAMLKACVGDC